jgi:hypothetical protein
MLHRLLIMLKSIYALQPYHVGSKHSKSLVICIPSKVAKEYNIGTSTIFALQVNMRTREIRLHTLTEPANEKIISSDKSLFGKKQPKLSDALVGES